MNPIIDAITSATADVDVEMVECVLKYLSRAGFAVVPVNPSDGLLVSMAMRWDHSFGMPHFKDENFEMGHTPEMRRSLMTSMKQIHEEVVGCGFYSQDREERYAKIIEDGGNP